MTAIRRVVFVLALARRRLQRRAGAATLVVIGIAGAGASLAAIAAGGLAAQDLSVGRALERVAPSERTVRVFWFGVPIAGERFGALDPEARAALGGVAAGTPIRALVYRETRVGGTLVDLAALDGVGRFVRLTDGRLPRPCTPARCEVVAVGGSGRVPSAPGLPLVVVGHGRLLSSVPFGQTSAYGRAVEDTHGTSGPETTAPFVVADGIAGTAALPAFAAIYRTFSWILPLTPRNVHPWSEAALAERVQRAGSRLDARSSLFEIVAPLDDLAAATDTGRAAGRRLLVVGGEAAALLLAFAALAAASQWRDAARARSRLVRSGAARWQTALLAVAEAGVLAVGATAVGWAVGAAAGALIADRAGSDAWAVLSHSALSASWLTGAALLAVAAAAVLVAARTLPPPGMRGRSISVVDVLAVAALAVVGLALARGHASAASLARERGTGTLLLVLPGLVAFAAAVALARLFAPVLGLAARRARSWPLAARLGVVSIARAPAGAAAAAAFLAVAVGLAVFAVAYRATLDAGASEQAAYAVPSDFVLREDPGRLVSPLALPRPPGARSVPVLRLSGQAGGANVTLLGVPADALPAVRGWRGSFASASLPELAGRLGGRGAALAGPLLPAEPGRLELPVTGAGDVVLVAASVATRTGAFAQIPLGETPRSGRTVLGARVPAAARGGRLVGLTLGLSTPDAHNGLSARGTLELAPVVVRTGSGRTVLVPTWSSWRGVDGVAVAAAGRTARLRYLVSTADTPRFRVRQPTDGRAVAALASSSLLRAAGPGRLLPVRLAGGQQLLVRLVAAASHFPSTYGPFVLADETRLATALNAAVPGSAVPTELWSNALPGRGAATAAALRAPPYDAVDVRNETAFRTTLAANPLSRAVVWALAGTAALAALLALAGIGLAVGADLRDERGDLFDLEAQGAGPRALRAFVRIRVAVFAAAGLLVGAGLGAALAALVVETVTLTASGGVPEPPLELRVGAALLAVGLALLVLVTVAAVEAALRRAFGAPAPARGSELA